MQNICHSICFNKDINNDEYNNKYQICAHTVPLCENLVSLIRLNQAAQVARRAYQTRHFKINKCVAMGDSGLQPVVSQISPVLKTLHWLKIKQVPTTISSLLLKKHSINPVILSLFAPIQVK
jgi:hypothetical protein